jgi:hypothetical protein
MATPDGRWPVEEIRVIRGGRSLTRLRVCTFNNVFVGEVSTLAELVALGVPLADLVEVDHRTKR